MTQEPNNYRVSLDVYAGPLDLLLYLIRREEVDIYDIPIARITQQYVKYVELLQQIDPDVVGQFLVLAATLMEIKSRMLLPTPPEEVADEDSFDPRADLVRQLLEYKRFKDVAGDLQGRADEFGKRFPRSPVIPDKDSMDLEDAEVWDLMAAFNKLMQQTGRAGYQHQVVYDDTPIATHALNIVDQLQKQGGSIEFATIFAAKSRPQCVGMFLALLELIRRQRVRADQDRPFGEIYVFLLDSRPLSAPEVAESFGAEGAPAGPVGMAARPPIGVDEPEGEQPEDSAEPVLESDEPFFEDPFKPFDTRPLRMEAAEDPDVVVPEQEPGAQTESGAEHDEAGNDRETRRDGAQPA
jgi:segregation and condensation protein A